MLDPCRRFCSTQVISASGDVLHSPWIAFVTTDCGMPAIWFKTSRGLRASASLPLQRTARDKRAAECLTNADHGCDLENDPTFSTWRHPYLFLPFKRFSEVFALFATLLDRERHCGALPWKFDLRGLGGRIP